MSGLFPTNRRDRHRGSDTSDIESVRIITRTTFRGNVAALNTTRNDGDVDAFLESVENERRREDSFTLKEIMTPLRRRIRDVGPFDRRVRTHVYKPKTSRSENEWFTVGFSPRKQSRAD